MKVSRGDDILKFLVIALPLVVLGNAIEYFFVTKDNLRKITGKVEEVILKTYTCHGDSYNTATCERTDIKLENMRGSFHVSDDAGRGAYIEGIQKGDEVSVYIRKWYQYILTFGAGKDIYGLEKDRVSYYDLYRWKNSNVAFIIIFSFFSLFFIALYILQRVTVNELIKGQRV